MPHFSEDRTLPLVAHVMMLLCIVTGFTALVAIIIAYVSKRRAPAKFKSHYEYVIRTFWVALAAIVTIWLFALSFTFFPFGFLPVYGQLLFLLVSLWVVVRSIVGIMRLTSGDGIINPGTWLLPTHPKFVGNNPA